MLGILGLILGQALVFFVAYQSGKMRERLAWARWFKPMIRNDITTLEIFESYIKRLENLK